MKFGCTVHTYTCVFLRSLSRDLMGKPAHAPPVLRRAGEGVRKKIAKRGKSVFRSRRKRGVAGERGVASSGRVRTVFSISSSARADDRTPSRVYVLELRGGYVYVGKTARDVSARMHEHMGAHAGTRRRGSGGASGIAARRLLSCASRGSGFTKLHVPTGRMLPRLGNVRGDGDCAERDETLRQMYKRGVQKVRGWKYVRPGRLTGRELRDIEENIRELFDLCRRCGKNGHFTNQCRESFDRMGAAI
jgi:hypothetical protein